jgi:uncharacterized protein (DUF433 family)
VSKAATLEIREDPAPLEQWDDGSVRVRGTRIGFDRFVEAYQAGERPSALARTFPSLSPGTIHRLIAYYLDHEREVRTWMEVLDAAAEEAAALIEERHPTTQMRARLKARLASGRAARTG